jgi:predicted nucleic acid-binding protein
MGQLNLPKASRIYIDTVIAIYGVEANQTYFSLLQPLLEKLQVNDLKVLSSELILLETLVVPIRNSDTLLITAYEQFLLASETQLIPISQPVLREAARLRATSNLRTPDAIHAATAMISGSTQFLTNDQGYRKIPGLPVVILDEVLAA